MPQTGNDRRDFRVEYGAFLHFSAPLAKRFASGNQAIIVWESTDWPGRVSQRGPRHGDGRLNLDLRS
ncbi:hypothetical protein DPD05_16725 [Salmonella enterica subsp. enterica serovar Ituri]|nr:hypothetical protein [Salmonella enterica subsp. enterica serovar Ituri]